MPKIQFLTFDLRHFETGGIEAQGKRGDLAKAEVGDLIVVFQSGAYGLTASPTAFLSYPACVEMVV